MAFHTSSLTLFLCAIALMPAPAIGTASERAPKAAAARATARIEKPVIIRNGAIEGDVRHVPAKPRERRCLPDDATAADCHLVVTDLE